MTRTEYSKRRFVLAAAPREMTVEEFIGEFVSAAEGGTVESWFREFFEAMEEDGWKPFLHYDPHHSGQILCWRRQVEVSDAE